MVDLIAEQPPDSVGASGGCRCYQDSLVRVLLQYGLDDCDGGGDLTRRNRMKPY